MLTGKKLKSFECWQQNPYFKKREAILQMRKSFQTPLKCVLIKSTTLIILTWHRTKIWKVIVACSFQNSFPVIPPWEKKPFSEILGNLYLHCIFNTLTTWVICRELCMDFYFYFFFFTLLPTTNWYVLLHINILSTIYLLTTLRMRMCEKKLRQKMAQALSRVCIAW